MFKLFKKEKQSDNTFMELLIDCAYEKQRLTDFAIEIAVKKITDVITSCGFKVITKDSDRKQVEYILNIRPNINQNAVEFWRSVLMKMIKFDEALVVNINGSLYLVDTFDVSEYVMKERVYRNVVITSNDNTLTLNRTFNENEVLLLKHSNGQLRNLLKSNANLIEGVFQTAIHGFNTKVPKVKVTVQTNAAFKDKEGNTVTSNDYVDKIAANLSKDEVYGFMASNGIDVSAIDMKCSLTSEDIVKLKNNVYETVAVAFGIPVTVFYGNVTEKSDANNEFITYACKSIIKELESCMSFAFISKEKYIEGDRVLVNKLNVKHIDVIESAGNLDKLYQNGWSHNDVLDLLGLPKLNEDWANERRFTKNYALTEETLRGGEK